ncbi:MAG: hypothetical protein ACOYXT_01330 [Bacteroidota bacterium]
MNKQKNQKPDQNQRQGQGKDQPNQQHKNEPSAQQGSGSAHAQSERQEEQSRLGNQGGTGQGNQGTGAAGEWKKPVVNEDEQRKATNTPSNTSVSGERSEEDDQSQKRVEPYKNIGDDSEETEKKEPVMK